MYVCVCVCAPLHMCALCNYQLKAYQLRRFNLLPFKGLRPWDLGSALENGPKAEDTTTSQAESTIEAWMKQGHRKWGEATEPLESQGYSPRDENGACREVLYC